MLNAQHMYQSGAGRFGGNAAARYGFQGGTQQFRPDANPYGQPIQPYQWNPQFGLQQPPPQGGGQPGGQPGGGVPQQPPQPPGGGVDHAANFKKLMQQDPRLAYGYTNAGDAGQWFQKNQFNVLRDSFGGDENARNQWAQQWGGTNNNYSDDDRMMLGRMAGAR